MHYPDLHVTCRFPWELEVQSTRINMLIMYILIIDVFILHYTNTISGLQSVSRTSPNQDPALGFSTQVALKLSLPPSQPQNQPVNQESDNDSNLFAVLSPISQVE